MPVMSSPLRAQAETMTRSRGAFAVITVNVSPNLGCALPKLGS